MTRFLFLFVLLVFISPFSKAQQSQGDKIVGTWLSETKEGKISVYRSGAKYYGKLIWSKSMYAKDGVTSNKDSKNEDPKLRNRPLKDLIILNNLKYSDGSYSGGTVYDPKNGSTYKCNMKLHGDRLDIRGYIGISIIGRTSVWTRIK